MSTQRAAPDEADFIIEAMFYKHDAPLALEGESHLGLPPAICAAQL